MFCTTQMKLNSLHQTPFLFPYRYLNSLACGMSSLFQAWNCYSLTIPTYSWSNKYKCLDDYFRNFLFTFPITWAFNFKSFGDKITKKNFELFFTWAIWSFTTSARPFSSNADRKNSSERLFGGTNSINLTQKKESLFLQQSSLTNKPFQKLS